MIDKNLIESINRLGQLELYELDSYIHSVIKRPRVTYIQRPSKCGQPHCKNCRNGGKGHGLYWYAKFRYKGKQYMGYVGKEKEEIDAMDIIKKKKRRIKKGRK